MSASDSNREAVRIKSEYGSAYTAVKSAFEDYHEKLNFRLNRRNSEYIHQPFTWYSGEESSECVSEDSHKEVVESSAQTSMNSTTPHDALNPVCSGDIAASEPPEIYNENLSHNDSFPAVNKKDSFTQTTRTVFRNQLPAQRKIFAPYALGNCDQSNVKHTFNVNSSTNVYPSALRAGAHRREKLNRTLTSNNRCTTNSKPVGLRAPFSNRTEQHNEASTNRTHSPLTTIVQPFPAANTTKFTKSLPQHNEWLTEYTRQFPVYPTSTYTRSASLAAGRGRPLSSQYNRNNSKRIFDRLNDSSVGFVSSRVNIGDEFQKFRDGCGIRKCKVNHSPYILAAH